MTTKAEVARRAAPILARMLERVTDPDLEPADDDTELDLLVRQRVEAS